MARYNAVIRLVAETRTQDDIGNWVTTKTERKVFANRWSTRSDLVLNAGVRENADIRTYQVHSRDYQGERKAIVEDRSYDIVGSDWRGERTILTLEGGVND